MGLGEGAGVLTPEVRVCLERGPGPLTPPSCQHCWEKALRPLQVQRAPGHLLWVPSWHPSPTSHGWSGVGRKALLPGTF